MRLLSEVPTEIPSPAESGPLSRYSWSWPFVFAAFFLLIGLQLVSYFSPSTSDTEGAQKISEQLRLYVKLKDVTGSEASLPALRENVAKLALAIQKETKESDELLGKCRLLLVAEHEISDSEPHEAALKFLRHSKVERDRAFAAVYGEPPSKWKSTDIARKIGDRNYLSRLAQVHAHEIQGDKEARKRILGNPETLKLLLAIVLIGLFGAGATSVGLWLAFFVRSGSGKLKPRGFPAVATDLGEADSLGVRVLLYICAYVILPLGIMLVGGQILGEDARVQLLISLASMAVLLVALLGILSLKLRPYFLGWRRTINFEQPLGKLAGLGIVGACMNLIPFIIGAAISSVLAQFLPEPHHPASQILQSGPGPLEISLVFASACIFAPILEEVVFRGLIGPALARKLNSPALGILISAALFASIHPQGIAGWPPLFALGAMFGLTSYYTRSLVPGIIMHALHNGLVLSMGLLL